MVSKFLDRITGSSGQVVGAIVVAVIVGICIPGLSHYLDMPGILGWSMIFVGSCLGVSSIVVGHGSIHDPVQADSGNVMLGFILLGLAAGAIFFGIKTLGG